MFRNSLCAILMAWFVPFTIALGQVSGPHAGSASPSGHGESSDLARARARIKLMVEIADGLKPAPAPYDLKKTNILVARAEQVKSLTRKALRSLDTGKVQDALSFLLTGNESFTDSEIKEVFGIPRKGDPDWENLLENLTPEEKTLIATEYTQARQALRKKLLSEVEAEIRKKGDARSLALAEALKMAAPVNLEAYNLAVKNIAKKKLDRPICFSCGEEVALDPREDDDEKNDEALPYDFSTAMGEAATKALVAQGLDNESGRGVFYNENFTRTSRGTIVQSVLLTDGKLTGKTASGSVPLDKDAAVVEAADKFYREVVKSHGGKWPPRYTDQYKWAVHRLLNAPKVAPGAGSGGTALAAVGPRSADGRKDLEKLDAYVEDLDGAAPSKDKFPKPEEMAAALGLVSSVDRKTPYLKYKGVGTHMANSDGKSEWGVVVLWDEIEKIQDPKEKARVMNILKEVKEGSIHDFKVVNSVRVPLQNGATTVRQDGYCLWCNLRNDPTAVKKLSEFFK